MPNDRIVTAAAAGAPEPADERLSSWKQIARYLGRDVRTVMRWEKEAHLPVHRVGGRRGSSVFAYRGEIDAWLRAEGPPPGGLLPDEGSAASTPGVPRSSGRPWRLPAVVALAALTGVLWALSPEVRAARDSTAAQDVRGEGDLLRATNQDGAVVWEYRHPGGAAWEPSPRVLRFPGAEPASDGSLLVAANAVGGNLALDEGRLIRFDREGMPLWSVTPRLAFDFQGWPMGPPWASGAAESVPGPGGGRILWALHHNVWWPSILVAVDAEGRQELRFVNAGWISAITTKTTEDGWELLVGGISNPRGGAMVALLPADGPAASSPEDPRSPYACATCPPGRPLRYLVLPPSDVSVAGGQPYNGVTTLSVTEEGVRAVVRESAVAPGVVRIWTLDPDLHVVRADASDAFWVEHRRLRQAGALDHDESVCPEREGPRAVWAWSPGTGWREEPIGSAR